jgi:hypothetical protein
VTEVPVLTEYTSQVAVAQKYGPGSSHAHEGALLTKVGIVGSHFQSGTGLAESPLPFQPVHSAVPGTKIAALKAIPQKFSSLFKLTVSMQAQIPGFEWNSVHILKKAIPDSPN